MTSTSAGTRPATQTYRRSNQRRPARPTTTSGRTVTVTGTFRAHPRGFGFLTLDTPLTDAGTVHDAAFVPPQLARRLLTGDQVRAAVQVADGRVTATRAETTRRTRTRVFGRVTRDRNDKLVLELDPATGSGALRLLPASATVGQWCLADLTPGLYGAEVVAAYDGPTPEALRAMMFTRHDLDPARDASLDAEAADLAAAAAARLTGPVPAGRRDLREEVTFTIDGASTRDLDDAISIARTRAGWRVKVHIADVASVVVPGTRVDADAAAWATSVYLPGWNRPMLPTELSEGVLSLLPGTDRDTLTVAYTVTADGDVRNVEVFRSRTRSDERLTYTGAEEVLAGRRDGVGTRVAAALKEASKAAAALGRARDARTETFTPDRAAPQWEVAVTGGSDETDPYQGATFTTRPAPTPAGTETLIERLMVAANEAVASWLCARDLPGVFRVHAAPGDELAADVDAAVEFLPRAARTPLADGDPVAKLLELADRPAAEAAAVAPQLLMRHLDRAAYVPEPGLHFGLSSHAYLHFTSPIRRYADLLVHRVIGAHLDGDAAAGEVLREVIASSCDHLTAASGTAARVEGQFRRFATELAFGEESPETVHGVVTGFNNRGAFVAVPDHGISGLVPFADLPGNWVCDDRQVAAVQSGTGNVLLLGAAMRCRVSAVDPWTGALDLARAPRRARRGRRAA